MPLVEIKNAPHRGKEVRMKNWMQRLALLAAVGTILSSAVLVGCGGGEEEETPAANNAANKAADDAE
jgi:hypothetical protein